MIHPDPGRSASLPPPWRAALRRHGFRRCPEGHARNGLVFSWDQRWLTFAAATLPGLGDQPGPFLGRPGLWTRAGRGSEEGFLFDLPGHVVSRQEPDELGADPAEREDDSLDAFLCWVLASAKNALPAGWQSPARERVESWLSENALTVCQGALVRQGELILDPARWALRFPVVPAVPATLTPAREYFLRELIGESTSQWRMARLGFVPDGESRALVCEADLSGAPHSEQLFLASLDGLRHVVRWLVEAADLLADVKVALRSLEVCCPNTQQERIT